jgi:geranylgeranyl diphosphate synthase type II
MTTMNTNFSEFVKTSVVTIDQHLNQLFENNVTLNADMKIMMEYSLNAGGKRIRPLIMLAILETLKSEITPDALTVAAAIEAVHTYSLIHDDLPAMDNDDLRRGRLTSHKKFGEAQAILTGDALLTIAFQWIATTDLAPTIRTQLIRDLALDAGASGMVAGQLLDIQGNTKKYTVEEMQHLHRLKTGRMLVFPATAALAIAEADATISRVITELMTNFGLAFQIHDDVIDVTESTATLGKTAGKDQNLNKNTYVNRLGLKKAQQSLTDVLEQCEQNLKELTKLKSDVNIELLAGFLTYLK